MRYHVTIAGCSRVVEIDGDRVTVDGRILGAQVAHVRDSLYSLLLDGRSWTFDARAGDGAGSWSLVVDGSELRADVVDERTRAIREMTNRPGDSTGPRPVRAPMPGMIVRIEVEAGESVTAGQGIAVIEAMKMENELKAARDGVVARVLVDAGQAVEKGTVLVEFQGAG